VRGGLQSAQAAGIEHLAAATAVAGQEPCSSSAYPSTKRVSQQKLIAEAFNLLFEKHGLPPIAM
jgi:hypothetical protein